MSGVKAYMALTPKEFMSFCDGVHFGMTYIRDELVKHQVPEATIQVIEACIEDAAKKSGKARDSVVTEESLRALADYIEQAADEKKDKASS